MTKKIFLLLILNICVNAFAQKQTRGTVSGKILSAGTKEIIEFAAVTLKNTADSSLTTGALSNASGGFIIKDLAAGSYKLHISYLGYKNFIKNLTISEDEPELDLGSVYLENIGVTLNEITVTGEKIPVTVKKDTIEFNAGSFKTRPDASTEELLKKLPGVSIDRDGNIIIQGQKVSRLTVDGKDFFGSDPKTATKNLPADAIDKVQVVDSKTEESKATGIDDGQREKVLNLTIKKDKKKGWFGNSSLSAGNTERYSGYLSANHFEKNLQFALLGMSNNTNAANFSFDDLRNFTGGDLGSVFAPPGSGSFSINVDSRGNTRIGGSGVFDNAGQGLVNTHAGGLNYSNSWGNKEKLKLSSSYFTYFSDADQTRLSNARDLSNGGILRTLENNNSVTRSNAHRFNLRMDYRPDSLTDISFRPNVILNSSSNINHRQFNSTLDQQGKLNEGSQDFNQDRTVPSLYGELSILRRLGSNKGSVSLRLNGTYSKTSTDWNNITRLRTFDSGNEVTEDLNQIAGQDNRNRSYVLNANYSRPVNKLWSANISYVYNGSVNNADQLTYDYNPLNGLYEVLVPSLSNNFDYKNWSQAARLGFIYNKKSLNYNFSVSLQQSGLEGNTITSDAENITAADNDYWNILPRFSLSYKPADNRTLQLNYNATVIMPSISNIQPVQNNSNPLYQREGNPDLAPRKNHRLTMNFNSFKPGTDIYWNGYFAYNMSIDAISNDTRIENGVQYVKPVNTDGNFFITTGTYFGIPSKIKGLRYNFGLNFFTEHNKSFINKQENLTNRYNIGPNLSINYDIEDKLNITLDASTEYARVNNSAEQATDSKYFDLNNSLRVSYEFIKDLRIETDLAHYGYAGRSDGFNQNYYLLNASLVKYFMSRKLNLAFRGFDILKQNTNINRYVNNTRIEDVQFNNLTRYFALALTYRLAKTGPKGERDHPRSVVN